MKRDDELNRELEKILRKLQQLMQQTYLSGLNIPQVRNSLSGDKPFWFSGNYSANKAMDKILADFSKQTNSLFLNGIERSWKIGGESALDKIQLQVSKNARQRKAYDQIRTEATQEQRNTGCKASALRFANEKKGGINLSGRVWNLGDGVKKEIEILIQNGMKEGKSPKDVAKMLQKHLKEPNNLYRRVRNKETGELELSEAAKKYKPGRGVYRSSYKNALRLARTEIPAAFKRAEWEKYQNDPTVKGIRIKLSNHHTCINPKTGQDEPFTDICDDLAGVYPKTFLWTGWHPQCRCEMYPILVTGEELRKMEDAKDEGKEYIPKQVTEPPKALGEWIEQNKERAKGWGNMPYWARDNKQFIDSDFKTGVYSEDEYTFTRARKVQLAMNRAVKELGELYPELENTELAAIHHYTKAGGNYRQLNKQLYNGTLTDFNKAAASLISKGLEELPKVSGPVYRGSIMKRKEYEAVYNGSEVTHKIFTSASSTPSVAVDFADYRALKKTEVQIVFEIQSKNGKNISNISEFNGIFDPKNQQEVLFDRGTKFRITSKEEDGSMIWIKMQEL
jgi:exonuclease VII small subunit